MDRIQLKLVRRIIQLLERIERRLDEPRQESPDAVPQKPEVDNESQRIPVFIGDSPEIRVHPKLVAQWRGDQNDDNRYKRRALAAQWATFFVTFLAFIAAAVYAGIAQRQKEVMDKTYVESQKQSKAATESTSLLRQQLVGTEAAIVEFKATVNLAGLAIRLENKGHVLANHVNVELEARRQDIPGSKWIGDWQQCTIKDLRLAVGPPGSGKVCPTLYGYSREIYDEMMFTRQSISIKGKFTYDDGFGNNIHQDICESWLGYNILIGRGGSSHAEDFVSCDEFPFAVRHALELKKKNKEGYVRQ
jgi:hypothetical protein